MDPQAALEFFKTRKLIASYTAVSKQAVSLWFKAGKIPVWAALILHAKSHRKVPLTAQIKTDVKSLLHDSSESTNEAAPKK